MTKQISTQGGQSQIIIYKKSIKKVFKSVSTYKRENYIQHKLIQPLNNMFVNSPFSIAYPQNDPNQQQIIKKELRMKKYEGDLKIYFQNHPNMTEDEIRLHFLRMVYPVYILHFNRIYHGDIKPDNYLYEITKGDIYDINITLTDFGGASWLNSRFDLIYQPHCYSKDYHPINLLDKNHPPFNPFLADCFMLGVILRNITSHLEFQSEELQILINLLQYKCIQIEDVLNSPWFTNNTEARKLLAHISKTNSKAIYSKNNEMPSISQQQSQYLLMYNNHSQSHFPIDHTQHAYQQNANFLQYRSTLPHHQSIFSNSNYLQQQSSFLTSISTNQSSLSFSN